MYRCEQLVDEDYYVPYNPKRHKLRTNKDIVQAFSIITQQWQLAIVIKIESSHIYVDYIDKRPIKKISNNLCW